MKNISRDEAVSVACLWLIRNGWQFKRLINDAEKVWLEAPGGEPWYPLCNYELQDRQDLVLELFAKEMEGAS